MSDVTVPVQPTDVVKGAVAGALAGLAASLAMSMFQRAVERASGSDQQPGDSATAKAADRISRATAGKALAEADKATGGEIVHYAFGIALGAAYGIAAELRPEIGRGWGTAFSAATFTLFDEVAVPAAGLADPPQKATIASQLFGASSHLVFGVSTEAARRGIRAIL